MYSFPCIPQTGSYTMAGWLLQCIQCLDHRQHLWSLYSNHSTWLYCTGTCLCYSAGNLIQKDGHRFFNLVELLSNYLESIADYVDLRTKSPESMNIESGINFNLEGHREFRDIFVRVNWSVISNLLQFN